jgi:hypothetical protein
MESAVATGTTQLGLASSELFADYVLTDARVIYYSIPKVACTSLRVQAAQLNGEAADLARTDRIHHRQQWQRTPKVSQILGTPLEAAAVGEDWLRFVVVRDPVMRLWSAWENKFLLKDPWHLRLHPDLEPTRFPASSDEVLDLFAEFVGRLEDGHHVFDDEHFRPQSQLAPSNEDPSLAPVEVYTIGQMGALQDRLRAHVEARDLELPPLARFNEGVIRLAPADLPAEVVARIEALYAEDYRVFPQLREEAGRDERRGLSANPIAALWTIWDRSDALLSLRGRVDELRRELATW